MKRIPMIPRKHGREARLAAVRARTTCESREGTPAAARLNTHLTYEANCEAYLWITDRGRSRLLKH